jgi:EAL domain-containing protein (putative c-di-GMP-specific phosphodiesterase class I)
LSPALDLWVCQEVKSHLQILAAKNYEPRISINLHPDTVDNPNIVKQIIDVLDGMNIEFEIVERSFLEGENVIDNLKKIKQHGFGIAIDDFGKGYFSYYTLADINANVIKIDKSLIELLQRQRGLAIWQHMINLCHDLRLQTIAEGVETQEQSDLLSELGIDLMQGFYFSEAIPVSQIDHYRQPDLCGDEEQA